MTGSVALVADTETQPSAPDEIDQAIAEVEEHFGMLFKRVRASWKEAAMSIHPDLQPAGYKILGAIVRTGETTANALAHTLETDKSVVSRQLRMLEDAGLVTSHPDAQDGRVRILTPTPEAMERMTAAKMKQKDRLRTALRGRPADEVRAFASMLSLLSKG